MISSLSMQKHDFDTAVKFATPEQLCDRGGSASPTYHVQGVRAAGVQLASLIYVGMRNSGYRNYTIFLVHTVSFVFIDGELTTPGGVHWRQITRKWPVSGPVLEERGAYCSAQGQITHSNHTSMIYKYCLVCVCQGMTSTLQSKGPLQNSCATGLGLPFRYTLFKVSAQLGCSWFS